MATTFVTYSTNQTTTQDIPTDDTVVNVLVNVVLSVASIGFALTTDNAQVSIVNAGYIVAGASGSPAVALGGLRDSLVNQASGMIAGSYRGVSAVGNNATIVNRGEIVGLQGFAVAVENGAAGSRVTNFGKLLGTNGYVIDAPDANNSFVNHGLVKAALGGATVVSTSGVGLARITNAADGTIVATLAVAVQGSSALNLTNHGRIIGQIVDSGGKATIIRNDGVIRGGEIQLGDGNDKYDGRGGLSGKVYGSGDNDRLIGGNGRDWLNGGDDRDTLTGGPRADTFKFDFSSHTLAGAERDIVTDFSHGQHDRLHIGDIAVAAFVFRGTSPTFAGGGTPSIRYTIQNPAGSANDKTIVHGDSDGNGVTDFQIELRGIHHLVAGDFVL